MKTIILCNIISNNTVHRFNSFIALHKRELGQVLVLFCAETEANRRWRLKEKTKFKFRVLPSISIRLEGRDLFTYFINPTIFSVLERFNPDRVVVCGWDQFAYQCTFIWAKFRQKQITLWSGSTVNERSWRRQLMTLPVRALVGVADDYIAYGQRAKEYLLSLGAKPKKIEIFINDVNGTYFREKAKILRRKKRLLLLKHGIATRKNLIYVGQLIERKGINDLLMAYQKVLPRHSDWGLIIVGYGQLETKLKEQAWSHNLQNVYFLGPVDQYDLPSFYVLADVLVLPSHEEVWGLVVNEALHSGLKVVASDRCGCVPDLIKPGKNGYSFKAGDVGSLTKALKQVLTLAA